MQIPENRKDYPFTADTYLSQLCMCTRNSFVSRLICYTVHNTEPVIIFLLPATIARMCKQQENCEHTNKRMFLFLFLFAYLLESGSAYCSCDSQSLKMETLLTVKFTVNPVRACDRIISICSCFHVTTLVGFLLTRGAYFEQKKN